MGLAWSFASGIANSPNAKVTAQIMRAVDFVCTTTLSQLTEGEPSIHPAEAGSSERHPSAAEQGH
jgi:hypothetical protein